LLTELNCSKKRTAVHSPSDSSGPTFNYFNAQAAQEL
jgi:hypothetical protein